MTEQSRANNSLQVSKAEFKMATKVFTPKQLKLGQAMLAFESGFLSIESGDTTAVMRATGEWHGRATFSPAALRALASVPPNVDPIIIAYAENHLLIGNMTIPCRWHMLSDALIKNLESPDLMDLLVLERTIPRAELKGSPLGRRIMAAVQRAEQRIQKAATQLADLDVTEDEIRSLIENKLVSRMTPRSG